MKCSKEWLRQQIKEKEKSAYQIWEAIEVAEAKDQDDLAVTVSRTKWVKVSDVLALLNEREKELRKKFVETHGFPVAAKIIREILGEK